MEIKEKIKREDAELEKALAKKAMKGELVSFITNLLEEAGTVQPPEIKINNVALRIPAGVIISDKSCYKKCLKESMKPGGKSYAACIKGCKPKTAGFSINIISA